MRPSTDLGHRAGPGRSRLSSGPVGAVGGRATERSGAATVAALPVSGRSSRARSHTSSERGNAPDPAAKVDGDRAAERSGSRSGIRTLLAALLLAALGVAAVAMLAAEERLGHAADIAAFGKRVPARVLTVERRPSAQHSDVTVELLRSPESPSSPSLPIGSKVVASAPLGFNGHGVLDVAYGVHDRPAGFDFVIADQPPTGSILQAARLPLAAVVFVAAGWIAVEVRFKRRQAAAES